MAGKPTRYHLGGDQEGDPGDDYKEPRGKVVGDDVVGHVAGEDHLKAGKAENGHECLSNILTSVAGCR